MPDITMCKGGICPKKEICYRHTAIPSQIGQSYFTEIPFENEECNYLWKNK